MKKQLEKVKKILQENIEDLKYLFIVGFPSGVFLIILSQCVGLGEVY